ncbi:MAG: ribosome maturation factor [Ginsengibacter sp.]
MNLEAPLNSIRFFLEEVLSQSDTDFLVDLKISQGNGIVVLLDGDDGVTIDKCVKLNKVLYKHIEDSALFPDGNFSLEVSSPGVDEPLKFFRQYKKNIGRTVQVLMNDDSIREGKLAEVRENEVVIQEKSGKGKKTDLDITTILFDQIKQTKVLITF